MGFGGCVFVASSLMDMIWKIVETAKPRHASHACKSWCEGPCVHGRYVCSEVCPTSLLDAVYSTMKVIGFTDVDIAVGETGWPTNCDGM